MQARKRGNIHGINNQFDVKCSYPIGLLDLESGHIAQLKPSNGTGARFCYQAFILMRVGDLGISGCWSRMYVGECMVLIINIKNNIRNQLSMPRNLRPQRILASTISMKHLVHRKIQIQMTSSHTVWNSNRVTCGPHKRHSSPRK